VKGKNLLGAVILVLFALETIATEDLINFGPQGPECLRIPLPLPECLHTATEFKCVNVLRVVDGDTVILNIPNTHPILGKKIGLRISHIDTPEMRGKTQCEKDKARMAKALVEVAVKRGKRFNVTELQRGKFFRVVGTLLIDGVSIADQLIKSGLAYKYEGGTKLKIDWCKTKQQWQK